MKLNRRMATLLVLAAVAAFVWLVSVVASWIAATSRTVSVANAPFGHVNGVRQDEDGRRSDEAAVVDGLPPHSNGNDDAMRRLTADNAALRAEIEALRASGPCKESPGAVKAVVGSLDTPEANAPAASGGVPGLAHVAARLHRLNRALLQNSEAFAWTQQAVGAAALTRSIGVSRNLLNAQVDVPDAVMDMLRSNTDDLFAREMTSILDLEPLASFRRRRALKLQRVLEEELYRLQFPSLATRAPPGTPLETIRSVANDLAAAPDDLSRSSCDQVNYISCSINKGCGFGCQAHHLVFCLTMAYGTNRTLLLDTNGWTYSRRGWDRDVLLQSHVPPVCYKGHSSFFAALPQGIWNILRTFHSNPPVWWIGQFVKFGFRLSDGLSRYFEERKAEFNWEGPVVGIHVRRTDKIGSEAQFHDLAEYMKHVLAYFDKHYPPSVKRRVYLASDASGVLEEAPQRYPNVEFLMNAQSARLAENMNSRYSDDSLTGIMGDVHFLAQTEYLVCTFSSQVCRMAFELMQDRFVDAAFRAKSLDDPFYYGGSQREVLQAWAPYQPASDKASQELLLAVGDQVENHARPDGYYWKGFNRRTQQDELAMLTVAENQRPAHVGGGGGGGGGGHVQRILHGQVGMYPISLVEPGNVDPHFPDYSRLGTTWTDD